jgi:nucleoside-diphosphate-sugar epimerase
MKIAVTGGNGELGRELVPYLLAQGHDTIVLDYAPSADGLQGAEYRALDMRDFGKVVAGLRGCDGVIHLAAHRHPLNQPDAAVYNDNTISSYNALSAAAALGIMRICLASSVNAVGGVFSRAPRYDYFPLDEQHPCYAEDAYSLSKWVLEQQADAFARRFPAMHIASLRFHWLMESRARAVDSTDRLGGAAARHLWSYTLRGEASRACLLALTTDFVGHEVFFIAAPRTATTTSSLDLAREHYPTTEIRGELTAHAAFFSSAKAERLLGWRHED